MSATEFPITIEQGATKKFSFVWTDADSQPYNLTECTAKLQIREYYRSRLFLEAGTNDGIVMGEDGKIDITLDATKTRNVYADGLYDLEVTWPGGIVDRVLQGDVTVSRRVTWEPEDESA